MAAEQQPVEDHERTLGEYLEMMWRSRLLVAIAALAFGLCGLLYAQLRTRKYESTVLLMPGARDKGNGLLAQLAAANLELEYLTGSPRYDSPSERTCTEILASRGVSEALAEKFNLAERYGTKTTRLAARVLEKRSRHSITRGKLINITVTDSSPELAAQLANGFADELNELLGKLTVTQSGLERAFLEKRLAAVSKDLSAAEKALREFRQKNEATGLTKTAAPEDPEVPLGYVRLLRDFRIQEKRFEHLTMQLEAARIQEARDSPVCQVVQRAKPSEKPSGLGTTKLVLAGLLAGLVVGSLAGIFRENLTTR